MTASCISHSLYRTSLFRWQREVLGLVFGPNSTPGDGGGRIDGHIKPAADDWAIIKGEFNVVHPYTSRKRASGGEVTNIVVLDRGIVTLELGDGLFEASRRIVQDLALFDIE